MANPEHVATARLGVDSIKEWWSENPGERLNLTGANLSRVDLAGANLTGANFSEAELIEANLTGANLVQATLMRADLTGANLSMANLSEADLIEADLRRADLGKANLTGAYLLQAKLMRADLVDANLSGANLSGADLRRAELAGATLIQTTFMRAGLNETNFNGADLSRADLTEADLTGANLSEASLERAEVGGTKFGNVDLSVAKSLETINHFGASTVGIDTLTRSQGQIPDIFLRGCGLTPWQILDAKLYDPALTAAEFAELQRKAFQKRTSGAVCVGGVFISYSHADSGFVDELHKRLKEGGISVWLDRHGTVTGPLQKQVSRAIRLNDVVVLVLSEASINSDWVQNELEMARRKENEEDRDVLCPVALDESWKAKVFGDETPNRQLWQTLIHKNILNFSQWETDAFNAQFDKLLQGMKIYYEPCPSVVG
jgi:uncharacterized protein YjbI with pentapeptide repeats